MRYSIFLFVCFLSFSSQAQTGSILVSCVDDSTNLPIVVCVAVKSDSVIIDSACTSLNGTKKFSKLPLGKVKLNFTYNGKPVGQKLAYVQANQVFQLSVRVSSGGAKSNSSGGTFELNASGETNSGLPGSISMKGSRSGSTNYYVDGILTRQDVARLPVKTLNAQAVMCVAYRRPLIDLDNGTIGYVYRNDDLDNMPMRSPTGFAATVAGTRLNEETGELNVRGARSDANTYYIDGMRVTSIEGVPKSYIGQMTIMTGGIPANYGDVMGGVIAINSKPIKYPKPLPAYMPPVYTPPVVTAQITPTPKPTPVPVPPKPYQPKMETYVPPVVEPVMKSFNLDRFTPIYENDFRSTIGDPNSTFSIDIDRASWTYVQNQYAYGYQIARDAVKLEEMINAFSYKKVEVPEEELMNVVVERSECSWNKESQLVTIHLKAKDLSNDSIRKPHNFVFLIDVSGSMSSYNKIQLLQKGLIAFVDGLKGTDRVSIVTYAGSSGIILKPTLCNDKEAITKALAKLTSGGSTNGIGGIKTAYDLAEKNYNPEFNNRIILCTDGDFNVGISNPTELEDFISTKRGKGIYLTALGFGMGNYRNDILETLADRGDGNHFYINNLAECNKVLVSEIGNLINIARDVKLNVEFNPKFVSEYRLIGYENRLLKPRDFEDDTKDAGEIGYGHAVTAVYEIILGKGETEKTSFTKSKAVGINNSDLAIVKLRYKSFEDSSSVERQFSLSKDVEIQKSELLNTVVSFGLLMRNSSFKAEMTKEELGKMAKALESKSEDIIKLKEMIEKFSGMEI